MRVLTTRVVTLFCALFIITAASASAQIQGLERVGPTSPTNGFPLWYQDKTGIALEFCSPTNAAELAGGYCLLLPGDTVAPEIFPNPFSGEHFYWAADGLLPDSAALPGGAKLVLGLEAAFANGAVISGDQITFARIRFVFDAPAPGTYTIYHPFGTDIATATAAGERIFVTEDIGLTCNGNFDCALHGRIGPFLLASNTPGGAELPAFVSPDPTLAGKRYIADPARLGPVTGSPVGQNFFRIAGPNGLDVISFDFALMGRLLSGNLGGRVTVEKARYGRAAGSLTGKTDVFATAVATTPARQPAGAPVGGVTPVLGFYPSACGVGGTVQAPVFTAPAGTALPMFRSGSRYYGQMTGAIPAAVCVADFTARDPVTNAAAPSYTQAKVVDQVTVMQALYDPANGGTIAIRAFSSDQNTRPALTPSLGPVLTTLNADGSVSGTALGVVVPPAMLTVTSAAGGGASLDVSTLIGQPTVPNVPFASSDSFTVAEDSVNNALNVLANDSVGGLPIAAGSVTITVKQAPALGTFTISGGAIVYTPFANRFGSDVLTYTLTNAAGESDLAFVNITIPNTNDAPVAVDDLGLSGVANKLFSFNVLANDTDPDGAADILAAVFTTIPAGVTIAGLQPGNVLPGGVLNFTAAAGSYTFRYRARDAAGVLSVNTATVSVTVAAGQTIGITRADFTANKLRWRIDGTSSPSVPGETMFIQYADGVFADGTSAVGFLVASTPVTAGLFTVDMTLGGANDPRNPAGTAFRVRPTRIQAISSVGGSSPLTTITVR